MKAAKFKSMKRILFTYLFLCVSISTVSSQTWQSISKSGTYETAPYRQFKIDPYRNAIWLVSDLKVAVIENSGEIHVFTSAELGTLWTNDNIQFVFTPTDIYYALNLFGLYSFTGYTSNVVDAGIGNYKNLCSNSDTIYITMDDLSTFKKYCNGTFQTFYKYYVEIDAKNQFLYGNNGSSAIFKYIEATNTSINLTSDPNYSFGIFHDTKFSRHSDTLYVGGKKGISYAYNYDFLDTITPTNTLNMPSANVLEIEFDHEDKLWAVFGDLNDVPFTIAKLEGNSWTNHYDQSNSPINFSTFYGLEIDTLGNLWVADNNYLHTLLTTSSPGWLGTSIQMEKPDVLVYPNPTTAFIQLSGLTEEQLNSKAEIRDLSGKRLLEFDILELNPTLDVSELTKGVYLLTVNQKTMKFVLE